jgi:CRP/FNR family transcriptional regulator
MTFEINHIPEETLVKLFHKTAPFSCLEPQHIDHVLRQARRIVLRKGEMVFKPGDQSTDLFVLTEGALKVSTPNLGYREVIHELLNAPAVFGLSNGFSKGPLKYFATGLSTSVVCYAIPFEVIRDLMINYERFNLCLCELLSKQLREKEDRLERLMLDDARKRVMDFILQRVKERGIQIGYEVLLKHHFTQQDIADFTGTSRQTVTNILRELKERKKIKVQRRRILIHDINDFH